MSDYCCNIYEAIARGSCFVIQCGSYSACVCARERVCVDSALLNRLQQRMWVEKGFPDAMEQ